MMALLFNLPLRLKFRRDFVSLRRDLRVPYLMSHTISLIVALSIRRSRGIPIRRANILPWV
jgi:hypothetical protein